MLLAEKHNDVATGGVMQTAKATIKASARVFNFFSDMVYANKFRAVVRELTANAIDAHVSAGKRDVPVQVELPTIFEPEFRVIDQGIGMSHDFVMGDFMAYADGSTKNRSNDLIGGFGVGSKSFLAYTDQATFRIVFDNVVSTYSMFKDEDGCPSIALLSRGTTDEPNGVAVSFPVDPSDIDAFQKAAHEVLPYFDPTPIVSGLDEPLKMPEYVARGDIWAMRPKAGALNIIMGGVKYPVEETNLSSALPHDDPVRTLLGYGLDVKLPIGSCSVALSREALSYDEGTVTAIGNALRAVVDEVASSFANMFDSCSSLWAAQELLQKEVGDLRYSGSRGKFLSEHAKYRGEPLEVSSKLSLWVWEAWTIDKPTYSRRTTHIVPGYGRARWDSLSHVTPGNVQAVFIDDLPRTPKSRVKARIEAFCDSFDRTSDVIAFRPYDGEPDPWEIVGLLAALGEPTKLAFASDIEPKPVEPRRGQRGRRVEPRFFQPTTNWLPGEKLKLKHRERWRSPYATEVGDPTTGYFVVMDQFAPPPGTYDLWSKGVIPKSQVFFVNRGDAKTLEADPLWQPFTPAFHAKVKELTAAYPELPQRLAVARIGELEQLFSFFRATGFVVPTSKTATPLGRIERLFRRYVEPLTSDQYALATYVTARLPARVNGAALRDAFKTQQPSAARLLELTKNTLSEQDKTILRKVL